MSMKPTFDEELNPGADDLLVFVDETGHEALAGNQEFYGLGGCVVLAAHYPHLKEKWRAVRKAINGDPDLPLHASEFERTADNFAVLSEFFLDPSFLRIAVTTTKAVSLPQGMDPCIPVMGQLQEEIAFAAALLPCIRACGSFSKARSEPMRSFKPVSRGSRRSMMVLRRRVLW
jgi:hypothetical protein